MSPLRLPAPAKLNLFLHITGQRADGYHLLQTVFQLIDHMDWLSFEVDDDLKLISDLPFPTSQNLIIRAAKRLQEVTGCKEGAIITLEKILPMGGGLGGGSSDAATTLLALNHLWQTKLSLDELAAIGLTLGADVPVFIRGQNAWAEGVGEILQAIPLDPSHFVVLIPDCSVSTAEIFTHPNLPRATPKINMRDYLVPHSRHGLTTSGILHNDCAGIVRTLYSEVDQALCFLESIQQKNPDLTSTPQLTGTGACVFMMTPTRSIADKILEQAPFNGFVCSGIGQSPVHSALNLL
ncbi:4-(cytidine 5'-diphospho)-2-C-methyl-D-erythritol kinase [Aquirhabdus parva]|uniref:4-diphosphocytidyl-2-C-methyl-D-erythritol kinase n=1 Tax=Aquirhabdus parva TaxID=2283318 RepID=A0A345P4U5_9GAMM|nr:4-(cytidine 5'-diphospho)-2-C-methyl-D-erythritol kinase [Aquirhabdus parva]AXI02304.1 4-(cytidine 5'-diphospho)-2-C-methyl-D-erythritol kinase [Aquirhabdus parva]